MIGEPIIDTNVHLFRWPFRRSRRDEPAALREKLRQHGVTSAWAGSFESLLHKDLAGGNARLAEECARDSLLLPFGSVNPAVPDWEEELRRCHEVHRMRGIRLYPSYHSYALDDPLCVALMRAAAERGLLVQIVVIMEDERTLHPLLRVAPVDVTPLPQIVRDLPKLRVMLLNAFRTVRLEEARRLAAAGNLTFEIAMLESVGGVANLLQQVAQERVLFGSHAPLFYFESAELKLKESVLTGEQIRAVCSLNAGKLLGSS